MDKYMQKAVQDYKAIDPPTMSRVAGWAMERRASELRLLEMLRRAVTELAYVQESPTRELCQTSEGASIVKEGTALLAKYTISTEDV